MMQRALGWTRRLRIAEPEPELDDELSCKGGAVGLEEVDEHGGEELGGGRSNSGALQEDASERQSDLGQGRGRGRDATRAALLSGISSQGAAVDELARPPRLGLHP